MLLLVIWWLWFRSLPDASRCGEQWIEGGRR